LNKITESALIYPIELSKTVIQVARSKPQTIMGYFLPTLKLIWKTEGIRGFYKGFGWWEFAGLPSQLLFFTSYNYLKHLHFFESHSEKTKISKENSQRLDVAFAGAIADIISLTVWSPFDIISQRLQIQRGKTRYKNGFDAIKKIKQQEGFKGFFRGFGASILASAPTSASWLLTYEQCKLFLSVQGEDSLFAQVLSGGIAGAVSCFVSNPLELIKTRLQTQDYTIKNQNQQVKLYRNAFSGVVKIIKEEGWLTLTRGLLPRLLITVPSSAIGLFTYELALRLSTIDTKKKQK